MSNCRFLLLAGALAVAVALSAGPAMATDDPPTPPPPPKPCTDKMRPTSSAGANLIRALRAHVIRGTARDLSCSVTGRGKVTRVRISIARKNGKFCQHLSAKKVFGRKGSCARLTWLPVTGTASWSFRLPKKLTRGTYVIRSRAVDAARNLERPRVRRVVLG
jgi:hypothetical protein